jgi:hypothetical protein
MRERAFGQASNLSSKRNLLLFMNKCTLVCTITTMMILACVCEKEEERNDGKKGKKASLTISGNGMETTHKTRIRRKK